ncbi:MAG TPA: PAS domain-containing sensor histidine kinase, partial [Sphingobacteriaceae bacterium]
LFQKKFSDLLSKGGNLHFEMFFRPLISASGVINQLSYDVLRKDGTVLPVFVSAVAGKNQEGSLLAVHVTLYDISERRLYEQELLQAKKKADAERRKFEFLSDFNPEIIWTANAGGEIDYVNKRYFQYFRTTEFQLAMFIERVCPADRLRLLRTWVTQILAGRDFRVEIRLRNQSDAYEWHLLKAVQFTGDDSSQSKWIGSCTNIDSQIRSIQKRDEFVNIASHELKTPLTSLRAYQQLLQRMDLPDAAHKFLTRTGNSLNALQFLVSSLLDVSKIDSGQLTLNLSMFRLDELVLECIDLVSFTRNTHAITPRFRGAEQYWVYADRERIMQVVTNLIGNAVKYSPNSDRVDVHLERSENGRLVRFEVRDYGMGIPEDKLDRIFDKYYRVTDTLNNNKASGLGLGLYIIQGILKQHQSRIYVSSVQNEGSCFYFSLPVSKSMYER